MASFCRMRAVLQARDRCISALPRRLLSSQNALGLFNLSARSGYRQLGVLRAPTLEARLCTTQVPSSAPDTVTDGDPATAAINQSKQTGLGGFEAIVSFEERRHNRPADKDYGVYSRKTTNPKKPPVMRTKKFFLDKMEKYSSEGLINDMTAYRLIRGCGNEMCMESPETRAALVEHLLVSLQNSGITLGISHYNALLTVYLENDTDFLPVDFLSTLQKDRIQPNRITFALLLQVYGKRGEMNEAVKLHQFMKQETPYGSLEGTYAALIDGYSITNEPEKALQVYQQMKDDGVQAGPYTYAAVLAVLAKAGDAAKLQETFAEVSAGGFKIEDTEYVKIITAATKTDNPDVLAMVFQEMAAVTDWDIDLLSCVTGMLVKGDYTSFGKLVKHYNLWKRGSDMSHSDLMALLLYRTRKSTEEARELLVEASKQGVNCYVLEDLLDYTHKRDMPDDSVAVLNEIRQADHPIKIHYFYPILASYGRMEDFHGFITTLKLLKECGMNADVFVKRASETLMNADREEEVEEFKQQLQALDLVPVDSDDVLATTFKASDVDAALSLIENENYDTMNNATTGIRIDKFLARLNDDSTAVKVLVAVNKRKLHYAGSSIQGYVNRMVKQDNSKQLAAFVVQLMDEGVTEIRSKTHTIVLSQLHRTRAKKEFFEYIGKMKEHNIAVDKHHYYQMLKMSSLVGNSAAAQFCFEKIKETGTVSNSIYAHLITAYGKDIVGRKSGSFKYMDKVIELYAETQEQNLSLHGAALSYVLLSHLSKGSIDAANALIGKSGPGSEYMRHLVYNEYLRAYGKRDMVEEARELFEKMKSDPQFPKPSNFSYNQFIGSYKTKGDYVEILRLMEDMKDNQLTPDKFTYSELVKAHVRGGDLVGAFAVLESLDDESLRPHLGTYMTVVRKCVHAADPEGVRRGIALVKLHKPDQVKNDELSHYVVFSSIKSGNLEAAEEARQAENCPLEPSVIRRICHGAALAEDMEYLSNIKSFVTKYNHLSSDIPDLALLRIYVKRGDVASAEQLYQSKQDNDDRVSEEFTEIMDTLRTTPKEDAPVATKAQDQVKE